VFSETGKLISVPFSLCPKLNSTITVFIVSIHSEILMSFGGNDLESSDNIPNRSPNHTAQKLIIEESVRSSLNALAPASPDSIAGFAEGAVGHDPSRQLEIGGPFTIQPRHQVYADTLRESDTFKLRLFPSDAQLAIKHVNIGSKSIYA